MKDPYSVIGLSRDSDSELLKARYKELHDLYGEQRFKSGEEGNEGARKLQELEEAWVIISANIDRDGKNAQFGGDYGKIDSLIRSGKYNEAQDMLDTITERNAQWHYMQAIVFYKREWLTEAKTQLEMAIQEDPDNADYRSSLEKLKLTIDGAVPNAQQMNNGRPNNGVPYEGQPQQQMNDMSNCLSTCCCAYCLTDCFCTALRCC